MFLAINVNSVEKIDDMLEHLEKIASKILIMQGRLDEVIMAKKKGCLCNRLMLYGAGEGNRTPLFSLGS